MFIPVWEASPRETFLFPALNSKTVTANRARVTKLGSPLIYLCLRLVVYFLHPNDVYVDETLELMVVLSEVSVPCLNPAGR